MRVLMIFIDGLGMGEDDAATNPVAAADLPTFRRLLGEKALLKAGGRTLGEDAILVPTKTDLGIPGLPQSATGQTTILTGVNGSQALGRHLSAYPTKTLKEIIAKKSIFKQLTDIGLSATSANAYSKEYFELASAAKGKWRYTASTLSVMAAGLPFHMLEDIERGKAVFMDITNKLLLTRPGVPSEIRVIPPQVAGERLAHLGDEHDFTFYEYFLTDIYGHKRDWEGALEALHNIDGLLEGVLRKVDLKETLVLITSDHGNVEDLGIKPHTNNDVPTILVGRGKEEMSARIHSLEDITPALVSFLST